MTNDYNSLELHKRFRGKIQLQPKVKITSKGDLSWVYTPGVGTVSKYLASHPEETKDYTIKGNLVAIISDGSAVLGLGNIGPEGAYPVMEGKAMLLKHFAGIDAIPILLSTQDPDQIIQAVKAIAPTFAAINLEDIAAPHCFYIEKRLQQELNIPIFHDDQWGTAVIVLAGLINACKVVKKDIRDLQIVVNGVGAAGIASTKLLLDYGITNITLVDSKGIVNKSRTDLNPEKQEMAALTNPRGLEGDLKIALAESDVFVGLSAPNILDASHIKLMAKDPVIFALANPIPEIKPDVALAAGAAIVATGRSDFPNQLNNALSYPGIFKGLLAGNITQIKRKMFLRAAQGLSGLVPNPSADKIIPSIFESGIVDAVAKAVQSNND